MDHKQQDISDAMVPLNKLKMMHKLKIRYRFSTKDLVLPFCLLLIPLVLGLQSFLPRPIEVAVIALKLIIAPLLIIFYLRTNSNYIWLLMLAGYMILMSLVNIPSQYDDFRLMFLNIFVSATFFMLGKYIIQYYDNKDVFKYLGYGVNIFNLISLLIYILVTINMLDIEHIYSRLNRPNETTLLRYALGNAIELPFGMTCILFASIVLVNSRKPFVFSVSLNLLMAIISQSRVVVLIAFILFVNEFYKSRLNTKLLLIIVLLAFSPLVITHIKPVFNSLIDRIKGHDLNSTNFRIEYFKTVLKNSDIRGLIFGHGLTSSSELIKTVMGIYKSVESVFLQLFYEIGILGLFIYFAPVILINYRYFIKGEHALALLFVYVQILFLLPVNGFMIATFFLFGACSRKKSDTDLNDRIAYCKQ